MLNRVSIIESVYLNAINIIYIKITLIFEIWVSLEFGMKKENNHTFYDFLRRFYDDDIYNYIYVY